MNTEKWFEYCRFIPMDEVSKLIHKGCIVEDNNNEEEEDI